MNTKYWILLTTEYYWMFQITEYSNERITEYSVTEYSNDIIIIIIILSLFTINKNVKS